MKHREYRLENYPAQELYRLVVDGEKIIKEKGWMKYEKREPGCISAFFKALLFATQYLDKDTPLTLTHLRIFNRLLGADVKREGDAHLNPPGKFYTQEMDGLFMALSGTHSFDITKVSLEGLKAFIQRLEKPFLDQPALLGVLWVGKIMIAHGKLDETREKLDCTNNDELAEALFKKFKAGETVTYMATRGQTRLKVSMVLKSLNNNLEQCDPQEKLRVILEHIQMFEWVHGFGDFNIRTFVLITLMRLCEQHGLTPPTFENPNMFDMHSVDELISITKKAMNKTKTVVETPDMCTFLTDNMSKDDKEQLDKMTAVYRNGLTEELVDEFDELMHLFQADEIVQDYLEQFMYPFELVPLAKEMEKDEEFTQNMQQKMHRLHPIYNAYGKDQNIEKAYEMGKQIFGKYTPCVLQMILGQKFQSDIGAHMSKALYEKGDACVEGVLPVIKEAINIFKPRVDIEEGQKTFQGMLIEMHDKLSEHFLNTKKEVVAEKEISDISTEFANVEL